MWGNYDTFVTKCDKNSLFTSYLIAYYDKYIDSITFHWRINKENGLVTK